MRFLALVVISTLAVPGAQAAEQSAPRRRLARASMSRKAKLRYHVKHTVGPGAVARSAVSAGINQGLNHPREWGQGAGGYLHRFGSGMAELGVKNAIQFGVGVLRHEDPRYYPSHRQGAMPRLKYALTQTFVGHHDNGAKTVAAGKLSGIFGAAAISRAWQPARLHTFASGFTSGGIMLGVDAGLNVFREFWPDLRQRLPRRKR